MTDQSKPDRQGGDELLPCPICKCTDARLEDVVSSGEWRVRCERCGCQTCWWHSELDARKYWNNRPTRDGAEGAQERSARPYHALMDADMQMRKTAPPKPAPDAMRLLERIRDFPYHERSSAQQAISQLATEAIAILSAPVPPAGGARHALEHAEVRFACLADHFREHGEDALQAMAEVDRDRMVKGLAALSPPCAGAAEPGTEQQIEDRLMKQDARDMLRLIDHIADKIGLPHNEELSRDNFNAWLVSLAGATEPVAWQPGQSIEDRAHNLLDRELTNDPAQPTVAALRAIGLALQGELKCIDALRAVWDDWTIANDESGADEYEIKDVSPETNQKVQSALRGRLYAATPVRRDRETALDHQVIPGREDWFLLAHELSEARDTYLNGMGQEGSAARRMRLEEILWNDKGTFIQVLQAMSLTRTGLNGEGEREATEFFQLIEDECWTLKCQSYPNTDDADIGWEVIEHYMAKPHERIVASGPTPLRAMKEAALARPMYAERARNALSSQAPHSSSEAE